MTDKRPVLYHSPQTRGGTTLWMNEELGNVCDIKLIDLKVGDAQTPDYLAINPMGKIPSLTHDGVVVTEAAAICAYLADAFPDKGLAPAFDDPARGAYFRYMFYAPSCIEPMMLDKFGGVTRENPSSVGHGSYEKTMVVINAALEEGPFLLGDTFSAADIVFGSTLRFATLFGAIPKEGSVSGYIDRLTDRTAFKAAETKTAEHLKILGS